MYLLFSWPRTTQLNSKVNQIKKNATSNQTITNTEIDCSRPFAAMLLNDDDCMRTQYVPAEPTVKILKRPTNDKNNQQLLAEQKPKAPIKTVGCRNFTKLPMNTSIYFLHHFFFY